MSFEPEVLIPVPRKERERSRDVIPIPLPNELPAALNLQHLPSQVLHSSTVETLIGQNEDLMARLKVNLRRNSLLEQKLLQVEADLEAQKNKLEASEFETQIATEKEAQHKNKLLDIETELMSKTEALAQQEMLYASLYNRFTHSVAWPRPMPEFF